MKTILLLTSVVLAPVLLVACVTVQPPEAEEALAKVLPSTTEITAEFQGDEVDSGEVDDGWITTFGDTRLDALVDEAIANNLNLRAAASQVDRAAGLARLAGASLKPMVGLGGGGIFRYGRSFRQFLQRRANDELGGGCLGQVASARCRRGSCFGSYHRRL